MGAGRKQRIEVETLHRHATLKQVADHAQVSIATASRALNGLRISPESQRRVLEAVDHLSYVPNEAARSLHAARTMTVAIVIPSVTSLSSVMIEPIGRALGRAGYTFMVATALDDDAWYRQVLERLLERRMDGVFCVQPPVLGDVLAKYRRARVPLMALIHRSAGQEEVPLITPEFERPSLEMFKRLHNLGHRRGLLLFRHGPGTDQARSYLRAAAEARLDVRMERAGEARETANNVVQRIGASDGPGTFVLTNYPIAQRIADLCASKGLSTPGDLSIIAVAPVFGPSDPPQALSTLSLDFEALGTRAAENMVQWLTGGPVPPVEVRLDLAQWRERLTTGPVTAAADLASA